MAEVNRLCTIQDAINIHGIIIKFIFPCIFFLDRGTRWVLCKTIKHPSFLIVYGEHMVSEVLFALLMEFVGLRNQHNLPQSFHVLGRCATELNCSVIAQHWIWKDSICDKRSLAIHHMISHTYTDFGLLSSLPHPWLALASPPPCSSINWSKDIHHST